MIPVIICGGVGTKMWPLSRKSSPKHFLPLLSGRSLFQVTYESLLKKFKAEDIYISTNALQADIATVQEPGIPKDNFIIEPEGRNQGPATALIAAFLVKKGLGGEPFMLVQPDDLREPQEKFFAMMDVCDKLARRENKYITGGIKPDYAIMGIDYLKRGELFESDQGINVYKVAKFIWRGAKENIEELVKEGEVLTHSNHSCMTADNMLAMIQKYKPEWYEPLKRYIDGADLKDEYPKMPPGPIEDVTQKVHEAGESLLVELPFEWIDIGTWESAEKYLKDKKIYNEDKVINIDSNNNYVNAGGKTVALIGVKDMVVVDSGDALLICPRSASGRVGEVVEKLKADGKTDRL